MAPRGQSRLGQSRREPTASIKGHRGKRREISVSTGSSMQGAARALSPREHRKKTPRGHCRLEGIAASRALPPRGRGQAALRTLRKRRHWQGLHNTCLRGFMERGRRHPQYASAGHASTPGPRQTPANPSRKPSRRSSRETSGQSAGPLCARATPSRLPRLLRSPICLRGLPTTASATGVCFATALRLKRPQVN